MNRALTKLNGLIAMIPPENRYLQDLFYKLIAENVQQVNHQISYSEKTPIDRIEFLENISVEQLSCSIAKTSDIFLEIYYSSPEFTQIQTRSIYVIKKDEKWI